MDRVVGDALEDERARMSVEIELEDLAGVGDLERLGRRQPDRVGQGCELELVVEAADRLRIPVDDLAGVTEEIFHPGVMLAAERAGDRNEDVHRLLRDDVGQRRAVPLGLGVRHGVEAIDGLRKPMPAQPVLTRFHHYNPVTRRVEGARQVQRLGHLAAVDEDRLRLRRDPTFAPNDDGAR